MKFFNPIISLLVFLFLLAQQAFSQVAITTTAIPPVSAYINQALSGAGNGIVVMLQNKGLRETKIRLKGKIVKSGSTLIAVKDDYLRNRAAEITLQPMETSYLTLDRLKQAFANFTESDLDLGISIDSLRDGLNYRLPEGQYSLCIDAVQVDEAGGINIVTYPPGPNCASFNICKLPAPQFIQPVNNFNINSRVPSINPASPVVFTWLPPQSSCGVPFSALTYNFEMTEILDDQTITDAFNNPPIFRKTFLRSSTFLLDTNLYKNILQTGKKYAIRVQADIKSPAPLAIENNGYSRIQAFQYGNNISESNAPNSVLNFETYYIPFNQRRTDFWDDIYSAYKNHTRHDTVVPVREYIALALTQNAIAYNSDAIELFLALNPDLANVKQVKLSHTSKLPVFPALSENDRKKFYSEYEANLQPDGNEENTFRRYLDSLHSASAKQNILANAAKIINGLLPRLDEFNVQVRNVNRISVGLINNHLSEVLFVLHSGKFGNNEVTRMQRISASILELTTKSPLTGSLFYSSSQNLRSLLCYYNSGKEINNKKQVSWVNYPAEVNNIDERYYLPSSTKQLLPFDVVIWRYSKEEPRGPVSDAPDLNGIYRVFYTTQALYNSKNPEVNARSTSHLASTAPVSLPFNSGYYLWAQNMLNHQLTKAQPVEINDAFLLANKKNWPDNKNYRIILKVD